MCGEVNAILAELGLLKRIAGARCAVERLTEVVEYT